MSGDAIPPVSSPASTSRKQFAKEVTSKDCVVIVLGSPGAGKTTFIHELTGVPMVVRPPELQLEPDTTEIDFRRVEPTSWSKGHRVFLIDTPAIDGPYNRFLFRDLLVWIRTAVKKRVAFIGYIYVHDLLISHITFDFLHLRYLFAPCVDRGVPHKLVLSSTKGHRLAAKDAEESQLHVEHNFWKELLEDGAKVVQLGKIGLSEQDAIMALLPEPEPAPEPGRLKQWIRSGEELLKRSVASLRP